jgi:hypothetical protein
LICLPCIILAIRTIMSADNRQPEYSESKVMRIIQSLPTEDFDPSKHKHETECVICMTEYKETDQVTQLRCY